MRESKIEQHLKACVERAGGLCLKFVSPGRRNVPDRIVFLQGAVVLVELKAPGGKPNAGQLREHERLRKTGARVEVIDTIEGCDSLVEQLMKESER